MIIIKKSVVLKDAETGGTGILKLERFMNRTSGRISLECPLSAKAYIDIDGKIAGVNAARPFDLDAEITQNSAIKAVVADEGTIIATGNSAGGKFNYRALINAVDNLAADNEAAYSFEVDSFEDKAQSNAVEDKTESVAAEEISENTAQPPEKERVNADTAATEEAAAEVKEAQPTKGKKRKGGKPSFIDSIRNNLQQLFDTYPAEEKLIALMPSSRWVKVPTEEDGYYVVGITQEDGNPKYLCYGIPDADNSTPPKSRPECRDWLSVEEDGSGYWLMYQDLESGEILKKQTV